MDLDDTLDIADAVCIDNAGGIDIRDLVDSIYNDKGIFSGCLPESPPDSSTSDHLMSPRSGTVGSLSPHQMDTGVMPSVITSANSLMGQTTSGSDSITTPAQQGFPDLSIIDYTVPLQLIEQGGTREQNETSAGLDVGIPVQGGAGIPPKVRSVVRTEAEVHETAPLATRAKRKRKDTAPPAPSANRLLSIDQMTEEPSGSPFSSQQSPASSNKTNIVFSDHDRNNWCKIYSRNFEECPVSFRLLASADKGFIFSSIDEAFIAQKKNHFQVTCEIEAVYSNQKEKNLNWYFVRGPNDNSFHEISYFQLNFYGIKLESPNTRIRVEQSQSDRSKVRFDPIKIDAKSFNHDKEEDRGIYVTSVGRLHFTETTANNMRKKGKPNPAQKYFQLVVAFQAVIGKGTPRQRELPLACLASEKIIVRASNPGQFEQDPEVSWQRDGDTIFHMGKVGINTDQASEALTVQGNIQVTGQLLQPSDLRIKERIRELDTKEQLENVNKIKIVQYKYRREFLDQLPEEQRRELCQISQTGVIAQDIQRIIPDAVSRSSIEYQLSNGKSLNDILIVNKDRLFLENVGAVRELSRMTGAIEGRLNQLEEVNENVTVKLARIKRKFSIDSTSTSSSQAIKSKNKGLLPCFGDETGVSFQRGRKQTLLQNKCIQMLLISLISIMALSLTAMAFIYIADYYKDDSEAVLLKRVWNKTNVGSNEVLSEGDLISPVVQYSHHEIQRGKLAFQQFSSTFSPISHLTTETFTKSIARINDRLYPKHPPVIGANFTCSESNFCRVYCCNDFSDLRNARREIVEEVEISYKTIKDSIQNEPEPVIDDEEGEIFLPVATNQDDLLVEPNEGDEKEASKSIEEVQELDLEPEVSVNNPSLSESEDYEADKVNIQLEGQDEHEKTAVETTMKPQMTPSTTTLVSPPSLNMSSFNKFSTDNWNQVEDASKKAVFTNSESTTEYDKINQIDDLTSHTGEDNFDDDMKSDKKESVNDINGNTVGKENVNKEGTTDKPITLVSVSPSIIQSTSTAAPQKVTTKHAPQRTDKPTDADFVDILNIKPKIDNEVLGNDEEVSRRQIRLLPLPDQNGNKEEQPLERSTNVDARTEIDINKKKQKQAIPGITEKVQEVSNEVTGVDKPEDESATEEIITQIKVDETSTAYEKDLKEEFDTEMEASMLEHPDETEPNEDELARKEESDNRKYDTVTSNLKDINEIIAANYKDINADENRQEFQKPKKQRRRRRHSERTKIHFSRGKNKFKRSGKSERVGSSADGRYVSDNVLSLVTNIGDFILDERFCDPNQVYYRRCLRHFVALRNVSFAIPISKFFSDSLVKIEFSNNMENAFALCEMSQPVKLCPYHEGDHPSGFTEPVIMSQGVVEVDVGSNKMSVYKIRYALRKNISSENLCDISKSRLGTDFKEFNFKFFRVCHQ